VSEQILDMAAITCEYLRDYSGVAALVGERVATRSPAPDDLDEPWVRVTPLDPENVTGTSRVEWLVSYYLQIDCYAGAENRFHEEAFDLARTVRAALVDMPGAFLEEAVVTDIGFASMPPRPDTDLTPARERFILDAEIYAHPKP